MSSEEQTLWHMLGTSCEFIAFDKARYDDLTEDLEGAEKDASLIERERECVRLQIRNYETQQTVMILRAKAGAYASCIEDIKTLRDDPKLDGNALVLEIMNRIAKLDQRMREIGHAVSFHIDGERRDD